MTLVWDKDVSGPATHALIVGVGAYPTTSTGLPDSDLSALALADWLTKFFRNPAAPLATIDLLASAPGGPVGYAPPTFGGLPTMIAVAPPDFEAMGKAARAWRNRLARDEGNIGLFFFTGHGGLWESDTLMFLDDLSLEAARGIVSMRALLAAMHDLPARQLYLIDVSREPLTQGFPAKPLLSPTPPSTSLTRAILYSAAPGGQAHASPEGPSPFTQALLAALEGATPDLGRGSLTPANIAEYANAWLQSAESERFAGQRINSDITVNFDFHFPTLVTKVGPAPGTVAAPAGAPGPAADGSAPGEAGVEGYVHDGSALGAGDPTGEADAPPAADGSILAGAPGPAADGSTPGEAGLEDYVHDGSALGAGDLTDEAHAPPAADGERTAPQPADDGGGQSPPDGPVQPADLSPPEGPASESPPGGEAKIVGTGEEAATAGEALTDFVPDDAEEDRDELGRAGLAIALAHKLHQVWRRANDPPPPGAGSRAAFVVHIDAPWGGGKTTFANFLGHVMNPLPAGARRPARFLGQRFPGRDAGAAFFADPPADSAAERRLAGQSEDSRRPWIVIGFNAWQSEHIAPPWWVFYQAIRKGCFDAIRKEGSDPWRPRPRPDFSARARLRLERAAAGRRSPLRSPPDSTTRERVAARWRSLLRSAARKLGRQRRRFGRMRRAAGRVDAWAGLWLSELGWRLSNPKVRSLLITAAFSLALLLLLFGSDLWGVTPARPGGPGGGGGGTPAGPTGTGFILTSGFGVLLAGLTGATAIWGLGALVTESIVPGTDTLAERLSLGSGDPFERFRRHFARTMERVRRPVMVVVDDLDRCRPEFVVDLVRGIQTLLRSPRVVFVILGDRDWIERAFEAHHSAMKAVDVGPEQSFGARFVEKAIQMSFILPALGPERQRGYLRRVLLGDRAAVRAAAPAMTAAATARLNEAVDRALDEDDLDPFDSAELVARLHEEVQASPPDGEPAAAVPRAEVAQRVNERLASRIVVSTDFETEVIHQLEPLSPYFPTNPRQIKRIVNAITLYYAVAVALQRPGLRPDDDFRARLALWVIVMTEWPKTWRLLASFPGLVDLLAGASPPGAAVPAGSPAAIARVVDDIRSDGKLLSLITGVDEAGTPTHLGLDSATVAILAELTPLHSRKRRLDDGPEAKRDDPEAGLDSGK